MMAKAVKLNAVIVVTRERLSRMLGNVKQEIPFARSQGSYVKRRLLFLKLIPCMMSGINPKVARVQQKVKVITPKRMRFLGGGA